MIRKLLFAASGMMLATSSVFSQITIEGEETVYENLYEAVAAAQNGQTILIEGSIEGTSKDSKNVVLMDTNTELTRLTIKGVGDGAVINSGNLYVINLNNPVATLNVENLTFNYTAAKAGNRNPIAVSSGSISLKDVKVTNANIDHANGVIALNGNNASIPKAVLENVQIVNCTTTAAGEVIVGNANTTVDGDCNFSLSFNRNVSLNVGENLSGHIVITPFSNQVIGSTLVLGCTNPNLFTLNYDGGILLPNNGNLVISAVPAILNTSTWATYAADKLANAINQAQTGEAITIYESVMLASRPNAFNGKTLTIQGNTDDVVITLNPNQFNTRTFFLLNSSDDDDITIKNLVIDGSGFSSNANLFEVSKGQLTLENVKIQNFTTSDPTIINSRQTGFWHLNGLAISESSCGGQQVTANTAGCTLSGDNAFTLSITLGYTVDAAGVANSTPVEVTLANPASRLNKVIFHNCTDASQFISADPQYAFLSSGSGLILGQPDFYLVFADSEKANSSYRFENTDETYILTVANMSAGEEFFIASAADANILVRYSAEGSGSLTPEESAALTPGGSMMTLDADYLNLTFTLTVTDGIPTAIEFEGTEKSADSLTLTLGNDKSSQSGSVSGDNLTIDTLNESAVVYVYSSKQIYYYYEDANTGDDDTTGDLPGTDRASGSRGLKAVAAETWKKAPYETAYSGGAYVISLPCNSSGNLYVATMEGEDYSVAGEYTYTVNYKTPTFVEAIDEAEVTPEYYTLEGVKIANPQRGGIYVKVEGNKATKVIF